MNTRDQAVRTNLAESIGTGRVPEEVEADNLLAAHSFELDDVRLFTERQLARRIKREALLFSRTYGGGLPAAVCEFILEKHINLLLENVSLNRLQRRAYTLYLRGLPEPAIARRLRVSRTRAMTLILKASRKIGQTKFKYAGLYEVYLSEVNRYIYRKPRHSGPRTTG